MSPRLYHCPYPLIGLTGGISTGKSTAAQILREQGQHVICADQLIKEIYQEKATFDFIQNSFPQCIVDQKIDFKSLRKFVFSHKESLAKLENFLYPSLEKKFNSHLPEKADFLFYDVPLLFEKNMQEKFDHICLIYIPREMQKKRLKQRDQISDQEIDRILESQWDIEKKKELADTVIDNSTSLEDLRRSLDQLLRRLPSLLEKEG